MIDNNNMTYQFSDDVSALIQAQIATGHFASEDDLIRQALDALERRKSSLSNLQALVLEADDDIAAGRVGQFNLDQTMAAIESRLAKS